MSPIAVTYKLNTDDIVAARWHLVRSSPSLRRAYRFGSFIVLVLTACVAVLPLLFSGMLNWTTGAMVSSVVALIWLFQWPRSYRRGLERSTQKLLKEGRNALLQCTFRMELDEHGLSVKSDLAESHIAWEAVERVEETESHIFITHGSTAGHAIPKWAFESKRVAEDFFEAARGFQRRAEFS